MRGLLIVLMCLCATGVSAIEDPFETSTRGYISAIRKNCNADQVDWTATVNVAVRKVGRAQSNAQIRSDEGLYLESDKISAIATEWANELATNIFRVADAALRSGCYKVADQNYRDILQIFTGASYAAHRQRAMVGIEDIRAKGRR